MAADDPRVVIPVRLRQSALDEVQGIADGEDWSRSEAIRYLLRLGLQAHRASHARSEEPGPGQVTTNFRHEIGRTR